MKFISCVYCFSPESFYLSDIIDYMYALMRYDNFKRIHLTPEFK